jgi:general L-amino acid transport system substrate-binding protein
MFRSLGLPRLAVLALLCCASLAQAGDILDGVKARGELRCGVSEGIPGFSQQDATGRWTGFDVDFCRAVAAAVLGDPNKVSFLPLKASTRFPALQARRIDLLVRNTSWTLLREASLDVQFPAILFYDGQSFLVPKSSGITKVADLQGATVCLVKGTTHIDNLVEYAAGHDMQFTPQVTDSTREAADNLLAGRCQAVSSDAAQLVALRLGFPDGGAGYEILSERISKEALAPAVAGTDLAWARLVRWVLFALIIAEEEGITQANVATKIKNIIQLKKQYQIAGREQEFKFGHLLGVADNWAERVIAAVGNYGELFERHLGRDSPLKIERGLNRLWTEGGLLYAPPLD